MFPAHLLRSALGLLLLAPLSAADILTVGPAGSGAQFTQIQAAVNAAHDDDVILVRPGSYQSIVVTKPLRILRDGIGGVMSLPNCQIRDIGTGKELVLSGVFFSPPSSPAVLVQNCEGTVVLQGLSINLPGTRMVGIRIENCRRAIVLASSVVNSGVFGSNRSGAVSALGSEVWIANSEISGTDDCCFAVPASHGVEVVNCTLHVWRSRIRGGHANSKQSSGFIADGGVGIKAVGSNVDLFGGPTALVAGGSGHDGFLFGPNSPGGSGLDLAQNSHARIQASLPVSGGFDGLGKVQALAFLLDGTSTATLDPKVFPTLTSSAQRVQIGSTFTLTLEGNPGGYQVLWLSLRTGPTATFRGVDGFGLLDRTQIFKVASEVLPPSAAYTLSFHVPSQTALLGSTLFFQAAERFTNGFAPRGATLVNHFAIGNPVLVTITN